MHGLASTIESPWEARRRRRAQGLRLRRACLWQRWLGLVSILLAGAQPSAAQEPPPERVTLAWALESARERNPAIQAAQSRYLAMRERPSQEGALPDPSLGGPLPQRGLGNHVRRFGVLLPRGQARVHSSVRCPW